VAALTGHPQQPRDPHGVGAESSVSSRTDTASDPTPLRPNACVSSSRSKGWFYLAAAGQGQRAVVAVLTALYSAVTIALAGALLHERRGRLQTVGLLIAAMSVAMISI
jgi:hypothetical protein